MKKKTFITFVKIIFISSIVSIYFFQIYLTIYYSGTLGEISKRISLYEKQTGLKYESRTKYEFYNYLKSKDKDVVITLSPSYNLEYFGQQYLQNKIFPLAGISNKKTVVCNENGYFSIYQSDRYGFNNPDSEWDKKKFEYVLVGDSFTQGLCVNRPHDIGSVLRILSRKNVLNLGYSANGPLFQYATLREYLKKNVKNVIWIYSENDLYDLNRDLKSEVLNNYLDNDLFSQNLVLKQNIIDESLKSLLVRLEKNESKKRLEDKKEKNSLIYKINKFFTIKNVRELFLEKYISKHELQIQGKINPKFKEVLYKSKKLANDNGSNFYFVFLPAFKRYASGYDKNQTEYNQVKKLVKELDITFIDVHNDFFLQQSNRLKYFPFQTSGHYNIEGYKEVTKFLYKKILEK